MSPQIIIIGGVPGAGKSTLASALSRKLNIPVFNKDLLESVIVQNGLVPVSELNGVGYELMEKLALTEVEMGRSLILDCVASLGRVKKYWNSFDVDLVKYIECVCTDEALHKLRLESRVRNIKGWYELTWADVVSIKENYEPCFTARLKIDSVNDFDQNLIKAFEYVSSPDM